MLVKRSVLAMLSQAAGEMLMEMIAANRKAENWKPSDSSLD